MSPFGIFFLENVNFDRQGAMWGLAAAIPPDGKRDDCWAYILKLLRMSALER